MPDLRRSLPLLLAGLLLTACSTPQQDTPADYELEGTPGSDDIQEPDPDPDLDGADLDDDETGEQQREDVFEGEALTDADMTSRLSPLGTHVVDGQGRTLYVFTADPDGERTCTGACLETWPIFSTDDEVPTVDGEVREELVGTIPGDLQVTYNDQPLYYYVGDDAVGDLKGHGIDGEWFVVATEGIPVQEELD